MTLTATATSAVDFAIASNDGATLAWLRRTLDPLPGLSLIGGSRSPHRRSGQATVGVLLEGLPEASDVRVTSARRIAIVLEDPIRILAGGNEPRLYASTLRPLLDRQSDRVLVLASDDLISSEQGLAELLDHVGLRPADLLAKPAPERQPISPGLRASLFSGVREDVEELEALAGRTFRSWRFSQGDPARAFPGAACGRTLFYAGREHGAVGPSGSVWLGDRDVLPVALRPLLDEADCLTIIDPLSFPFESLDDVDRGIPVLVGLPTGYDAPTLSSVLGSPLLRHLTPFDRVAISDDDAWGTLRRQFSFGHDLRVTEDMLGAPPVEVFGELEGARARKTAHWVLARAVSPLLQTASASVPAGERVSAIVVGEDVGRWMSLLRLDQCEVLGIDGNPDHVAQLNQSFPEWRFQPWMPRPQSEWVESNHLAFCAFALCSHEQDERVRRLDRLFKGLRVGGLLLVLDRFLEGESGRILPGPGPRELLSEILRISSRHVQLEHAEAIRLPTDNLTSVGLFGLRKLGGPARP